jgi:hypothetical protein
MEVTQMTWIEANNKAQMLWTKWVSDKPASSILTHGPNASFVAYDLQRIHASILQEFNWHRAGKSKATPALISETRGDLITWGKVHKALNGFDS